MSLNSLQEKMDRRAAEMAQMAQHAKDPQEIQAIQQHLIAGVQNGSIKPYIGVPLIQELTQKLSAAKASMAMGAMGGQPQGAGFPIAQQVMQQAEQENVGVGGLPSGLPQEYAGGGIIAFADGGMSDEDDDETSVDFNTKDDDAEDAQIMAMFAPKRRTAGLESLMAIPAGRYEAEKVSPSGDKYEAISVEKGQAGGADERLLKHILHKESRGQRYDKEGNLLTSVKGAMGEMQVMPGTSRDPGFGISPARGNDPDELRRVGDEYARAMLSRYKDPKLAAIAYNWGPGNTDKWLSAGADMSKLPKETRGYIQGLAGGGAVRFQNRGIVDLGDEDYTTIEGLLPSDLYKKNMRKAQGIADLAAPRKPGQMLPGFNERMSVPEDYTTIEGLQPSTLYADAMRAAKGNPPAADTTPSRSVKDVLLQDAAAKENAKQALIDKVANSDYAKQMGNVAGFFGNLGSDALSGLGTLGKHLVSAPGYGFSSQGPARAAVNEAVTGLGAGEVTAPGLSSPEKRAVFRGQLNKAEQEIQAKADAQESQAARDAAQAAAAADKTQAAPAQADSVSELMDILKQQRTGINKQREIDNYLSLLSAGLGAAGGKSRNALENINAGAQQGIAYMLQAGKTRSADERNLLSGHLGLEKAKMYSAAQQAGREDRDRARLMDNLAGFEKNARGQAIALIGQDKLGAMEPAVQQATVDRMVAKILSESKPYQSQMKRLMGEDYMVPSNTVAPAANWTYDPTKRKLSAS